jgi:Flp pilus assembly protein TadG
MFRPMLTRARPQVRRCRDETGATAVEFAIVVLPLVGLVFGLIAYGYMLSFRQAISQGAAEAARAAAIWHAPYTTSQNGDRQTAAIAAANEALKSYGVTCGQNGTQCTVSFDACEGGSATCAAVTISYPYADQPLIPLPLIPLPGALQYTAETRAS